LTAQKPAIVGSKRRLDIVNIVIDALAADDGADGGTMIGKLRQMREKRGRKGHIGVGE